MRHVAAANGGSYPPCTTAYLIRMLRVGELVRHALAAVFARGDIDDPLLEGKVITVPEVRMSNDLKLANVYIMPLGGAPGGCCMVWG